MATGATGSVRVRGLSELVRDFYRISKDVGRDIVDELEEAAQPVKLLSEEYVRSGGGGFPPISGVANDAYYSGMRVGVSRAESLVYVAPAWSSDKGTLQGAILAVQLRFRMEGALEDQRTEVYAKLEQFIDTLAHLYDFY